MEWCNPAGSPACSAAPSLRERDGEKEGALAPPTSLAPTAPLKKERHSSITQIVRDQFMDNSTGQTGKGPRPIVMSFPGTDRQTSKQTDRQGNSQMAKRPRPSLSSCARAPDPVLPWEPGGMGVGEQDPQVPQFS